MNRPFDFLERLQIGFTALLLALQFAAWNRLPHPGRMALFYVLLLALTWLVARWRGRWAEWLRHLVPIAYLLAIYESLGQTTPYLVSRWFEPYLVALDRNWFGAWLQGAAAMTAHPWLVDLLFLAYVSYYVLPVVLLTLLFLKKSPGFRPAVNTIAVAFYAHYLLYLFFPVVGPHRNPDLVGGAGLPSGGWVTALAKAFIQQAEWTTEDCFPSAHASIAILCVLLAWRYYPALFRWFALPALLITLATVVLRFHYVMDVLAGAVLALAALRWAPAIEEQPAAAALDEMPPEIGRVY